MTAPLPPFPAEPRGVSFLVPSHAHDQREEKVCYAHPAATLVMEALRRCGGATGELNRRQILDEIVQKYGREGGCAVKAMESAAAKFIDPCLDDGEKAVVRRLDSADEVRRIVREGLGKVCMGFYLSKCQWKRFGDFLINNPTGVMSRADLGEPMGELSGHAVTIEDVKTPAVHSDGGVSDPSHFWRIKNSWGAKYGVLGTHCLAGDLFQIRDPGQAAHAGTCTFHYIDVPAHVPARNSLSCDFVKLWPPGLVPSNSLNLEGKIIIDDGGKELGKGAFGRVLKARPRHAEPALPAALAVKCANPGRGTSQLLKEAQNLLLLRSLLLTADDPGREFLNIPVGFTKHAGGEWCIVMRRARCTLAQPFDRALVLFFLSDVASALSCLHRHGFIQDAKRPHHASCGFGERSAFRLQPPSRCSLTVQTDVRWHDVVQ
jgi:hypothetical protein